MRPRRLRLHSQRRDDVVADDRYALIPSRLTTALPRPSEKPLEAVWLNFLQNREGDFA